MLTDNLINNLLRFTSHSYASISYVYTINGSIIPKANVLYFIQIMSLDTQHLLNWTYLYNPNNVNINNGRLCRKLTPTDPNFTDPERETSAPAFVDLFVFLQSFRRFVVAISLWYFFLSCVNLPLHLHAYIIIGMYMIAIECM